MSSIGEMVFTPRSSKNTAAASAKPKSKSVIGAKQSVTGKRKEPATRNDSVKGKGGGETEKKQRKPPVKPSKDITDTSVMAIHEMVTIIESRSVDFQLSTTKLFESTPDDLMAMIDCLTPDEEANLVKTREARDEWKGASVKQLKRILTVAGFDPPSKMPREGLVDMITKRGLSTVEPVKLDESQREFVGEVEKNALAESKSKSKSKSMAVEFPNLDESQGEFVGEIKNNTSRHARAMSDGSKPESYVHILTAGPGAGKTTTIATVAVTLSMAKARVLALMFNVEAEKAMHDRLTRDDMSGKCKVSTRYDPLELPEGIVCVTLNKFAYQVLVSIMGPEKARKVNLGDQVLKATELLEEQTLLGRVHNADWVILDESQDITGPLVGFFKAICDARRHNAIIAGDARQEVYTGAQWFSRLLVAAQNGDSKEGVESPASLLSQSHDIPGGSRKIVTKITELKFNHRSSPRIVDMLNFYDGLHFSKLRNEQRCPESKIANNSQPRDVEIDFVPVSQDDMADAITEELLKHHPDDVYVIAPVTVEKFGIGTTLLTVRNQVCALGNGRTFTPLVRNLKRNKNSNVYVAGSARKLKGTEAQTVILIGANPAQEAKYFNCGISRTDYIKALYVCLSRAVKKLVVLVDASPLNRDNAVIYPLICEFMSRDIKLREHKIKESELAKLKSAREGLGIDTDRLSSYCKETTVALTYVPGKNKVLNDKLKLELPVSDAGDRDIEMILELALDLSLKDAQSLFNYCEAYEGIFTDVDDEWQGFIHPVTKGSNNMPIKRDSKDCLQLLNRGFKATSMFHMLEMKEETRKKKKESDEKKEEAIMRPPKELRDCFRSGNVIKKAYAIVAAHKSAEMGVWWKLDTISAQLLLENDEYLENMQEEFASILGLDRHKKVGLDTQFKGYGVVTCGHVRPVHSKASEYTSEDMDFIAGFPNSNIALTKVLIHSKPGVILLRGGKHSYHEICYSPARNSGFQGKENESSIPNERLYQAIMNARIAGRRFETATVVNVADGTITEVNVADGGEMSRLARTHWTMRIAYQIKDKFKLPSVELALPKKGKVDLDGVTFIALDLETNGYPNSPGAQLLEIGAIAWGSGTNDIHGIFSDTCEHVFPATSSGCKGDLVEEKKQAIPFDDGSSGDEDDSQDSPRGMSLNKGASKIHGLEFDKAKFFPRHEKKLKDKFAEWMGKISGRVIGLSWGCDDFKFAGIETKGKFETFDVMRSFAKWNQIENKECTQTKFELGYAVERLFGSAVHFTAHRAFEDAMATMAVACAILSKQGNL